MVLKNVCAFFKYEISVLRMKPLVKRKAIFRMPQKEEVLFCLKALCYLIFPDHLRIQKLSLAQAKKKLELSLIQQIEFAFLVQKQTITKSGIKKIVFDYLHQIPSIRQKLLLDAQAAVDRDAAVESIDEVILCYPGFQALMCHRLAHELAHLKVPLLPRMMSEVAHSQTGCDIHPEAKIGEAFFIDHATGVVIGQTAVVGNRVTLFQGVTLGSIAMQDKNSQKKRHPTLEDDVVVYSNATILGGDTVIGKRSVIGGSCWITFSVAADSKVILANPRSLLAQSQNKAVEFIPNWDI